MKWYKRDPDAWLAGVTELTPEERGIYDTVIEVLNSRNLSTPNDDDQFWAKHCNCNPRTWRRVRDSLLAKGKLYFEETGQLMAKRVRKEFESASKRTAKMVELRAIQLQNQRSTPGVAARTTTTTTTTREEREGSGILKERIPALMLVSEAGNSAPVSPSKPPSKSDQEKDLFRRGREVLGERHGWMVVKILKVHEGEIALARSVIEKASTKDRPVEYLGGVLRGIEKRAHDEDNYTHGGWGNPIV